MNPILNSYIQAVARKYELNEDSAFEVLSASLILDKPFDEVYQNIWVGSSDDCGFDAVHIDDQTNTIYIFQSKNSPSLSENQLMKLETDFTDFFVGDNRSDRRVNTKLQAWLDEYKDRTQRGVILTPRLFFVYHGQNSDGDNAGNAPLVARVTARTTGPEYNLIDSDGLIQRITNLQRERRNRVGFTFNPLETNIPTYSRQAFFSFIIGQVTGASFRIEALQLCELIEAEIAANGSMDTLFSDNIRGYLGRNKANKRILTTLRDRTRSPLFPFMNNGLTVVCESVSIPATPQVNHYNIPVVNPVIVNGLQTTRVIYDVFLEDRTLLEGVFVTLKVYESRDQILTDLITEATNTQTSINFKDQMSNKSFNEIAHVYFAARGVKYISKRGEIVRGDDLTVGLIDSVNNETVLKFWYATFGEDPHLAKISKNSLLENIFLATKGENPQLNDLFDGRSDSPVYAQMFLAYRIQKLVAEKRLVLGVSPDHDYLLHADEIASYGIYRELTSENELTDPDNQDLEDAYTLVKSRIQSIVESEKERRGEAYSHTKYFKGESVVQDYDQAIP